MDVAQVRGPEPVADRFPVVAKGWHDVGLKRSLSDEKFPYAVLRAGFGQNALERPSQPLDILCSPWKVTHRGGEVEIQIVASSDYLVGLHLGGNPCPFHHQGLERVHRVLELLDSLRVQTCRQQAGDGSGGYDSFEHFGLLCVFIIRKSMIITMMEEMASASVSATKSSASPLL